ncbi:amidohydrolase [Novosphingobium capsulatum]|uniref:amidohydrolase n=1 Tax=Novosphingobium capsulatum TaxID=13688 RepID=UPI0007884ACF|nr:amidohydrolase [Novosphingobium capsulatum]WQD94387.1 amidohydrolase [Novosphingobium capsulatum]
MRKAWQAGVAGLALVLCGASGAQARQMADLILHNGQVLTVDKRFAVASAVVVRGDRIVAVGGEGLLKRFAARDVVDLKGRTLMPGFIDTHLHPAPIKPSDIAVASATSMAQVQGMLRDKARALGPGQWITGYGWQEANLAEKRNITRADLDAAVPDNPVLLVRAGSHSAVANSLALKLAGIDRNTPDPAGGLIEHDANGEPNGIIRESYGAVLRLIPQPGWDVMKPATVTWLRSILALGITSFHDASGSIDDEPYGAGGPAPGEQGLDLLGAGMTFRRARELYAEMGDRLPRVTMYISYPGAARLKAFPHNTGYGDNHVRLGAIGENAVDGGFTGPTAWLLADYKGQPGFRGKGRFTDAQLQEMVDTAAAAGWQMGLHCIGDAAIVQTVNAYDMALKRLAAQGKMPADHRWFTDHFTIMPPDATMQTMARDKVMIAQQPNFLYNLEDRYTQVLDDWRLAHNNAVATPVKKFGLFMAFGSDNLPVGPLVGLYAAITRKGPSGVVHDAEEAVSRAEAIRMYTANGAYLSWEESQKGTLEPGKLADMIVLPFDPLTAPPEALLKGKVDMTFVGGKLVYDSRLRR